MTAQQDVNSISALLEAQSLQSPPLYHERSLEFQVPTVGAGPFPSQIEFNLDVLKTRYIDYSLAYVQVPFTISPAAAATFSTTPFPAVAFKSSFASMFSGISVRDSRGTIIVDDRVSGSFANHIRIMLERDSDFSITRAPQIGFATDQGLSGVRGLSTTAQIRNPSIVKYFAAPVPGVAGNAGNGDNFAYNAGFQERMAYLQDSTFDMSGALIVQPTAGVYTGGINGIFNLPLRYLHDFFAKLDFPITGLSLVISLLLNTPVGNNGFCPITIGSTLVAGGANTPDIGDNVNGNGITISVSAGGIPRLYYHSVEFDAATGKRALEQLSQGFTKTINYSQYDLYTSNQNLLAGEIFTHTISTSTVAARRVFALCYPAGLVNTSGWPGITTTGPFGMDNISLSVNNKPLFRAPLLTLGEQYTMLMSAMSSSADDDEPRSLISYSDFVRTNRLLCLDLTRTKGILPDSNIPVSLIISGKLVGPAGSRIDVVYVVERAMTTVLNFGLGRDTAVATASSISV